MGEVLVGDSKFSGFNVPNFSSRSPIGIGSAMGAGLAGRGSVAGGTLLSSILTGQWKGKETHVLTTAEMPTHGHVINVGNSGSGGAIAGSLGVGPDTTYTTLTAGSDTAHTIVQPVYGINFIIKT